jgi:HSP20 family molecular chaperone IbpA
MGNEKTGSGIFRFFFFFFFSQFSLFFAEEVKKPAYDWNQTLKEVCLTIPLPEGCNKRAISVSFKPEHLKVVIKGNTVVDGALHKRIKVLCLGLCFFLLLLLTGR